VEIDFTSRNLWPMAIIEELEVRAGEVRNAVLRYPDGTLKTRPLNCLYPLEIREATAERTDTTVLPEPPNPENCHSCARCHDSTIRATELCNHSKDAHWSLDDPFQGLGRYEP
jgi:hypothetical protein